MKFIGGLFNELLKNGKMLIGYILMQVPGITDYPGLVDAIHEFLADPTSQEKIVKLIIQIFLAGAAGHRVAKIIGNSFRIKALENY